jgi:hypothetical protein
MYIYDYVCAFFYYYSIAQQRALLLLLPLLLPTGVSLGAKLFAAW